MGAAIALAVGGAAAGGLVGWGFGAISLGLSVGLAVGGFAGSYLFPGGEGQTQRAEGPRLNDLSVQTSRYGTAISEIWGAKTVVGTPIWSNDLVETRHKETQYFKGPGKIVQITYTYSLTFAVGLCKGPITGIGRVWLNKKLYADFRNMADQQQHDVITVYLGTEAQTADPTIQSYVGTDETPGYRGLAYLVFDGLQLGDYGNMAPTVEVEILVDGTDFSDEDFVYDLPTESAYHYHTCIDLQRNLIVIDRDAKKIYKFQQLTNVTLQEIDFPVYDGEDYGNSTIWDHVGMAACVHPRSGALMLLFNPKSGYSAKKIRLVSLGGQANNHDISVVRTVGQMTDESDWNNWPTFVNPWRIAAYDQDGTGSGVRLVCLESYYDKVYVWDDLSAANPNFVTSFTPQWPLNQVSYFIQQNYVEVHPTTGNMWISGADSNNYWAEYSGISATKIANHSYTGYDMEGISWHIDAGVWVVSISGDVHILDTNLDATSVDLTIYGTDDYPNVGTIISDICQDAGMAAGELDVTDLSSIKVHGYTRPRIMTARQAIEPLMAAFLIDCAEIDKKLVFTQRGQSGSEATITADELAATEDVSDQEVNKLTVLRAQESELPKRVEVKYLNQADNYEIDSRAFEFYHVNSENQMIVDLPIVISATEAYNIAYKIIASMWTASETYRFSTTGKYKYLTPTDIVTVDGNRMRIVSMGLAAGLLQFEAVSEYDDSLLSSDLSTNEGGPGYLVPAQPADTTMVFLDIGPLSSVDNNAGFWLACYHSGEDWRGCTVYDSIDGGSSFVELQKFSDAATYGTADDALGGADGDHLIWDLENTVTVSLTSYGKTLSSSTIAAVLNGANKAALAVSGGWEIFQFVDVTDNGDGNYTLSTLLRGRHGSEWAITGHAISDEFVLLDDALQRIVPGIESIGLQRTYRATTANAIIQSAVTQNFTPAAVCLKPFSVDHVTGSRDGSDNLTIDWIRRDRIDGEWRDNVDVGLSEDSEAYEVDVMNGATVERTISVTTNQASYTAAQQTTDFGSTQSSVTVKIYQMSAVVGRGYEKEVTV